MLGALRSTVLIVTVLLAACAGTGPRGGDRGALPAPERVQPEQQDNAGGMAQETGVGETPALDAPSRHPQAGPAATQALDWRRQAGRRDAVGVLYAMAYFPAPSGVAIERANRLAELYADARAGYGLYSFLLGGPSDARMPSAVAAYGELLRVIDTYVMSDEPSAGDDRAGRHGFLVPVEVLGAGAEGELYQRVRPRLSTPMQAVLARQLRLFGHVALADRLEQSPGPFLVTSVRPALLPLDARQPLLIVDLQPLGPEYMYSVVDAYDRPIPSATLGRRASLAAIERRLQAIFPSPEVDSGAAPAPAEAWIWLLPDSAQARAVIPARPRGQRERVQSDRVRGALGDVATAGSQTGHRRRKTEEA